MTSPLSIAQLLPQCPLPATDGGKVGLLGIIRGFDGHGCDVTAAMYSTAEDSTVAPLRAWCTPVQVPLSTKNTPLRIAASILRPRALYMWKHDRAAFKAVLQRLAAERRFDVVHADHTSMAPLAAYLSKLLDIPWGLRLHNIEYRIWERYAERFTAADPRRWYLQRQTNLLRIEEQRWIAMADVVFPITRVDEAEALRLSPDARTVVAPAGIFPDDWPPAAHDAHVPHDVIITASYKWRHNADGLQWFVREVWPFVRLVVPTARLRVCGTSVPAWIDQYSNHGVVNEGFVDDLRSALQTSAVAVVPLFVGSGVRIKIIESMAAGVPVVSTSIGAEGIDAGAQQGLFLADDAATMADRIATLLQRPDQRAAAAHAARDLIHRRYTWAASTGAMLEAYRKAIERRAARKHLA